MIPYCKRTSSDHNKYRTLLFLIVSFFCFTTLDSVEAAIPTFSDVCPSYFQTAHKFLDSCKSDARSLTRIFVPAGMASGQPETHSILFATNEIASHFGLGCMLDRNRKLQFLGIYYSTAVQDFGLLNSLPITFIDFEGDAGFLKNSRETVAWAVRVFSDGDITTPYKIKIDLNCETALQNIGPRIPGANGFRFQTVRYRDTTEIRSCVGLDTRTEFCRQDAFASFFEDGPSDVLYNLGPVAVIRYNGEFDVREKLLETACLSYRKVGPITGGLVMTLCK